MSIEIKSEHLEVMGLGVGHGDATLIRFHDDENARSFVCLIDGGPSHSGLQEGLQRNEVDHIDLVILTHFDSDHINGLAGLTKQVAVGEYWAPALNAFTRHDWLFGQRGRDAIERGQRIEEELKALNSRFPIIYPMEGFTSDVFESGDFLLQILSPAARIVQTLLTADNIDYLVTQTPTPLGWLAEPDPPRNEDQTLLVQLDNLLSKNYLTPEELAALTINKSAGNDTVRQMMSSDPEFFGDSLMNNTSLVVWIQARTGNRTHRLLFPGDQENWVYLLMKNPRGLQADILKVPHHGGAMFLESRQAEQEVLSTVRPKCVMISANGRYNLPHATLREAARRWGATVFCTSRRQLEYIQAPAPSSGSCHKLHDCSKTSHDFRLILDAEGIRSTVAACVSGLGSDPGPIIEIYQHVVEPSRLIAKLFDREMKNHVDWVEKRLVEAHAGRKAKLNAAPPAATPKKKQNSVLNLAVPEEQIATEAREKNRLPVAVHVRQIFQEGMRTGRFWAGQTGRYPSEWRAYALPSPDEFSGIISSLRQFSLLLFMLPERARRLDRTTLLGSLNTDRLADWMEDRFGFPTAAFREAVWPKIFGELSGWKAFSHPWGVLGLSQKSSLEVYKQLIGSPDLRGDVWSLSKSSYSSPHGPGVALESSAAHAKILTCGDWEKSKVEDASVPYDLSNDTPLPRLLFCSTADSSDLERYGVQVSQYSRFTDCSCFSRPDVNVSGLAQALNNQLEQLDE